ncbi:MAG: hypothetical protein ABIK09_16040, partial [Pseudomonadota bacterium]
GDADCEREHRCLDVPVTGGSEKRCVSTPGSHDFCSTGQRCTKMGNWITYWDFVQNGNLCFRMAKYPDGDGYLIYDSAGSEYSILFYDDYSIIACPSIGTARTCKTSGDCASSTEFCEIPGSGISCSNNYTCTFNRLLLCLAGDVAACQRTEICNNGACTAPSGKCKIRGEVEYYSGDLRSCSNFRIPKHDHAQYCGSLGDDCNRLIGGMMLQPDGTLAPLPNDPGLIKLCAIGLSCCGWWWDPFGILQGQNTCRLGFWCP